MTTDATAAAAGHSRILVTSRGADLLDDHGMSDDSILAAVVGPGERRAGPFDGAGRPVLGKHHYLLSSHGRCSPGAPRIATPCAIAG